VGLVIGYVAVQSGSLLPSILFHLMYNTLGISTALGGRAWWLAWLPVDEPTTVWQWPVIVVGTLLSVAILVWFHRLPRTAAPPTKLGDALCPPSAHAPVL